ncbi:MAG TPA: ABC transporter ATP-binding protein [Candidatus Polarisedimenticolia bacterium]|jgi:subfamily B ATP-binding cassette protein MsbA|nr:ABC transporter ATP-binding protein [Candidatus Polarisedimenticolia bacterium]
MIDAAGGTSPQEKDWGAWAEIRRLLPYARPHRVLFGATLLVCVSLSVIDVPIPFFLKKVIDAVLRHHESLRIFGLDLPPRRFLLVIFLSLATLAAIKGLLTYLQRTASEKMGQRMIYDLRLDLYRHLQSLSMPFFRNASTGRIMLRFMGDINAVLDMITDGFLRALMDTITILVVAGVILELNWKLALVVMSVLPFYAFTFLKLSPALRRTGRKARHERSALSGTLQEKIAGRLVVKAYHQEAAEEALVESQTASLRDWLIEKARVGGKLTALANVAIALGGALVLWIGGNHVLKGEMTKGGLMAFYALAAMLFPPLRRLARTNETYQAARVSLDRILDFLDQTTPLQEKDGTLELKVTRGDVVFEDVRFSYVPGVPVLRGISVEIPGGQVVAVVGPNGAGKTTLLSLLPRFIDPDGGRVLIDGRSLRDVTLLSLRRQIGIVTQEPFLFSGTVEDNIRYGRPGATEEEVWQAARVANAFDFISSLPEGFRTEVGERGQRLSGGQIQRIALARAVINNPPILILDEATSAVDAESERLIREALLRLMQGRTVLVIAHRISTVQRADRILVMDGGLLVEEGRHDSLYLKNGPYTRICREQLLMERTTS